MASGSKKCSLGLGNIKSSLCEIIHGEREITITITVIYCFFVAFLFA